MGSGNVCMICRTTDRDSIADNYFDIKKSDGPERQGSGLEERTIEQLINIDIGKSQMPNENLIMLQSALRGYLARKIIGPQLEKHRLELFCDGKVNYEKINDNVERFQAPEIASLEECLPALHIIKPKGDSSVILVSPIKLEDGTIYSGEWDRQGKMSGIGTMLSTDGAKLTGYFKNNKLNGIGRYIDPLGFAYQGEFKDGEYDGEGQFFRKSGGKFEGNFKDGIIEGNGKEEWPDGVKYEGDYKNGMKHGQGVLIFDDGVYTGQIKKNKMHGKGCLEWKNGNRYDGEWKNNMKHGFGEFKWTDGRVYEGNWSNDIKEGKGRMKWPNGREYSGNWHDGKQHGKGKITKMGKDGKIVTKLALWEEGNREEWIE